jgi:hypothetical protein
MVATMLLGACRADDIVAPVSRVMADVNHVIGEAHLPAMTQLGQMGWSVEYATIAVPAPSNCGYSQEARRFVCPRLVTKGMEVDYAYELFDALGVPQTAPDPRTTASVHITTTARGITQPEHPAYVGAFDQTQDITVSGLLTEKLLLDGSMLTHRQGRRAAPGAPIPTATIKTTIVGVTISRDPAPASAGTIMVEYWHGGPPMIPGDSRLRMTFDGTCTVKTLWTAWVIRESRFVDMEGRIDLWKGREGNCASPSLALPVAAAPRADGLAP